MPIVRPSFTDDDGSLTTGTVFNNAWYQAVLDAIDDAIVASEPGTAEVWIPAKDFFLDSINPAAALATRNAGTFRDYQHMAFDGASAEVIHIVWAPPKRWNRSTFTYQVYWSGIVAGAGGVTWSLAGHAVSDDDTMNDGPGAAVEVTDTFLAVDDLHVSAVSGAVTCSGAPAIGDVVRLTVKRNPSAAGDTRTQDANFIGLKLIVTMTANNDA